jgi:hypothetical protein
MDRSQLYMYTHTHTHTHTPQPVQQLKQAVISADTFFHTHTHTNMPPLSTHRNVLFSYTQLRPASVHLQTPQFSQFMHSVLTVPTHHQLKMGFNNCSSSVQCDLFLCPHATLFFLESPCGHLAAPGSHTLGSGMDLVWAVFLTSVAKPQIHV